MEQYPSIDRIIRDTPIYAYDKLDGSNIRVEWSRKTGFMKYGSRTQLIDSSHPFLGSAIPLFNEKYADVLDELYRKNRFIRVTAFLEYHSPNSFAGFHADEQHDITLIDTHIYKQGLMLPKEFNQLYKHVPTAKLLYQGNANSSFVEKVRTGTLPRMTFEGVVCKAGYDNRRRLVAFKIKN
ncbi:MAG: RNA ligase family protein, partial [Pseudomonadota bacterium]|nr:RNA ligase family protein [Pseudomonadota bacterium]